MAADPPDYGTGLNVTTDWPLSFQYASGLANLGNNLLRRLTTPRGSLAWDRNCGWDVRQLFRSGFTADAINAASSAISAECEKDERVESASTELTFIAAASTLIIAVSIITAAGPFVLVLSVDNLTVQILKFSAGNQ